MIVFANTNLIHDGKNVKLGYCELNIKDHKGWESRIARKRGEDPKIQIAFHIVNAYDRKEQRARIEECMWGKKRGAERIEARE